MRSAGRAIAGGIVTLLALAAAAVAVTPQVGVFEGPTSQNYPDGGRGSAEIEIEQRRASKRIVFEIAWLATCDGGFTQLSQGTRAKGTVGGRGRFRGRGRYFSDGGNLAGTQYTATIRNRLRGRFVSGEKAKGTFRANAVLRDAAGVPVSSCATGPIRWRARRR